MHFKAPVPIFRIFDFDKARAFYIDFLGFTIDWQHQFDDNSPLYLQISLNQCVLHLSEHHGDSAPGGSVRIQMSATDLKDYQQKLLAKNYVNARPGIEAMPWGMLDMKITDPFFNRLIFTADDAS